MKDQNHEKLYNDCHENLELIERFRLDTRFRFQGQGNSCAVDHVSAMPKLIIISFESVFCILGRNKATPCTQLVEYLIVFDSSFFTRELLVNILFQQCERLQDRRAV